MDGSPRVRAASVLPRYSPSCLLKGHLSTKSNAFCTDSSSLRLNTLHLVKNHMAIHYNKILSAKAAVDCSVPLSMSASVKYADQQRREKLKKELARCERGLKVIRSAIPTNFKNNSKSLLNTLQKPTGEPPEENVFIEEMNGFSSFIRSSITSSERPHTSLPKSEKVFTDGTEKSSSSFLFSMDDSFSRPRKPCSGPRYGRGARSTFSNAQQFQFLLSKTPSGDLLDKHSELFSNRHLPFTPRTLKTEAKSFLSQYRYYTPAKRKKDFPDRRAEVETQTELSSFKSDFDTVEIKNFTDSRENINQGSSCIKYDKEKMTPLPLQGHRLTWGEGEDRARQHSTSKEACQYSSQPPAGRTAYSDDEELLYLSFIEEITEEILKLGLFSNRFLEQLFERHVKQNRHRLEERKMRHLLHVLKLDLGCTSKENSALDDAETFALLDFERAGNPGESERKHERPTTFQLERQEYQEALGMLSSVPKDENETAVDEFHMPAYKSTCSDEVEIQQVNDEPDHGPSMGVGRNPGVCDSFADQETYVNVIEGDSDTEKAEPSTELDCLSTALAPCDRLCSIGAGDNHDSEPPTLHITGSSFENCPLEA